MATGGELQHGSEHKHRELRQHFGTRDPRCESPTTALLEPARSCCHAQRPHLRNSPRTVDIQVIDFLFYKSIPSIFITFYQLTYNQHMNHPKTS